MRAAPTPYRRRLHESKGWQVISDWHGTEFVVCAVGADKSQADFIIAACNQHGAEAFNEDVRLAQMAGGESVPT